MNETTQMIYDGHEKGLPRYALQNAEGAVKCMLSCGFCKAKAHVWVKGYDKPAGVIVDWKASDAAMDAHIAGCDKARNWRHGIENARLYMRVTVFHWLKRSDGGHACNARCMSACGPSCECRCQGKNHGGRG